MQEQGVFLLLDDHARQIVEAKFSHIHQKHKQQNILHVSLYQFVAEKMQSTKIEEYLAEIAFAYDPIELSCISFSQRYENVALTFEQSDIFSQVAQDIIGSINPIRSRTLLRQVQHMNLNSTQKSLVDKYGVPWGVPPGKTPPHMTLQYNERYKSHAHQPNPPKTLMFPYIALGELGKSGNVISIQKCFKFGRKHA